MSEYDDAGKLILEDEEIEWLEEHDYDIDDPKSLKEGLAEMEEARE